MRAPLLLFCLLPACLAAQHCGYDLRSIIVVRPHAVGDSTVVHDLRITLLDSNNVPVVHYDEPHHLFRRNTPPPCSYGRAEDRLEPWFPFAHDNYVLVVPNGFRTQMLKVLVQDERDDGPLNKRGDRWPVRFKQQLVPLTVHDVYPLCGRYDEHTYPPLEGRPDFAPVDITLQPR